MTNEAQPIGPTEFRCAQCGYDVSGSVVGGTCPECGKSIRESLCAAESGAKTCGTATSSMVIGILAFATCGLLGPIAIWLYVNAKNEMTVGGFSRASHAMARAGLVLGIVSMIFWPIVMVLSM